MKTEILGVNFDHLTLDQAVDRGLECMAAGGFHYVVTPNPEFILAAEKDQAFLTVLNGADLTLPDGVGVVYAANILGTPLPGRVPGIDFASGLLERLNAQGGARLFLLGAKPGVAQCAGEKLAEQYPNLIICGTHDGYFTEDAPVVRQIAQAEPDLLFVCLGAPKQEKWMARWGVHTGCALAVGLGGALDVFSGKVERAPEAWQKAGMEWAYRLVKEPTRIGRMAKLPLVLTKAAGQRLMRRKEK